MQKDGVKSPKHNKSSFSTGVASSSALASECMQWWWCYMQWWWCYMQSWCHTCTEGAVVVPQASIDAAALVGTFTIKRGIQCGG